MKNAIWAYVAGALMFIVFILNLYVGLVDRNLFIPPNYVVTPHYYFNWIITGIDIIASALLFFTHSKKPLLILSGIIWPIGYIGTIGLDIGTRLCLGAPASTCFPSSSSAASYLLLGSSSFLQATFWPYTFILIVVLLISTIFSAISFMRAQRGHIERPSSIRNVEGKTEGISKGEVQLTEKRSSTSSLRLKFLTYRKYRFIAGFITGLVIATILVAIFSGSAASTAQFVGVGGIILSGMTYIGIALILFGYFYKKDCKKPFLADFALGLGVGMLLVWFMAAGVEAASNGS